jgi:hypothetical protein
LRYGTEGPVAVVGLVPVTPPAVAAAVAAGSAALGTPLTDPVPLAGSARSAVLRCRDGAGATVVVKSYPQDDYGAASFAAEAAGLALTGASGLGPRLLAADEASLTVVMSDLGDAPSLADVLLGGSAAAAAAAALLSWAGALGRLAVHAAYRESEHARLLAQYLAGRPGNRLLAELGDRIRGVAARAALLGVPEPAGLAAELAAVAGLTRATRYRVFSPGDACTDNNQVAPDGVRFLDYEDAGFHSVFLDAAYLRMPFSTCWCVFRLPAGLAAEAEADYRSAVCRVHADLTDDAVWQRGVRQAMAAWTMNSMGWLLNQALAGNAPLSEDRPAPGARQLLRHRWRVLAAELTAAGELPALTALVTDLLAATESWQVPELGPYPALRDWPASGD